MKLQAGMKIGKWTLIDSFMKKTKWGTTRYWNCVCECGEKKPVRAADIKKKKSNSCWDCAKKLNEQQKIASALKTKLYRQEYAKLNKDRANALRKKRRKKNLELYRQKGRDYYHKSKKPKLKKAKSDLNNQKNNISVLERQRIWAKNNPDKIKAYKKKYRSKNRHVARNYHIHKMNTDPRYKMRYQHYKTVNNSFRRNRTIKCLSTLELLGCNSNEYFEHIEKLLEPWMNWNNYGPYRVNGPRTWNIDHIIPVSSFNINIPAEAKKAFNYKNCRPLCSKENLEKGDKLL
jgi:hypothetical protein